MNLRWKVEDEQRKKVDETPLIKELRCTFHCVWSQDSRKRIFCELSTSSESRCRLAVNFDKLNFPRISFNIQFPSDSFRLISSPKYFMVESSSWSSQSYYIYLLVKAVDLDLALSLHLLVLTVANYRICVFINFNYT